MCGRSLRFARAFGESGLASRGAGRFYDSPVLSPRGATSLVALACVSVVAAGCGLESTPEEKITKPGDPAPAERALRLYLDDDRCDLMSDDFAETLDPDPDRARRMCEAGTLPVDALVRPGEYTVKDAEVIDRKGLVRIILKDGGIRDYTLAPGGREGYRVESLKTTTTAEYGDSLRLQARESPKAEPVDAAITVLSLKRVPMSKLSEDEFASSLDRYYLLRVRIRSLSDRAQLLGSAGFQLVTKDGIPVAEPREMYTDLGEPLPGILKPMGVNEGDVFFAAPAAPETQPELNVKPAQVRFVYGDQYAGDTLIWSKPPRRSSLGQSGRKGG